MKSLFLILTLFLSQTVFACDSYEDCMKPLIQRCIDNNETQMAKNACLDSSEDNMSQDYLKAIAYKLDEISKWQKEQILNNRNYGWDCIKRASDGFCQEERKWQK